MNDWKAEVAKQYEGDACGYYAACARLIIRKKVPFEPLTDEMVESLIIENRHAIAMPEKECF